jgi:uncharacterized protein (DUF305 family)
MQNRKILLPVQFMLLVIILCCGLSACRAKSKDPKLAMAVIGGQDIGDQTADSLSVPYDLQFIDTLIVYHQKSIALAKLAQVQAIHRKLQNLAYNIILEREHEISQLQKWRDTWYSQAASAANDSLGDTKNMITEKGTTALQKTTGPTFDIAFLEMMISHNTVVVDMAEHAMTNARHPELREFAQQIEHKQSNEIGSMQALLSRWSK